MRFVIINLSDFLAQGRFAPQFFYSGAHQRSFVNSAAAQLARRAFAHDGLRHARRPNVSTFGYPRSLKLLWLNRHSLENQQIHFSRHIEIIVMGALL